MRLSLILLFLPGVASAQFVYPKPGENRHDPWIYQEDPFIIEYRHKFFAVFKGDFETFDKAYTEIEGLLKKNPRDARALVWLGNGQTVRAGLMRVSGKADEALKLVQESRRTLDRAVALRPEDPNIYMMRAATLYIQGQYWPSELVPRSVWATLRSDCERFIRFIGPARLPRTSLHLRGEAFGELGIACKMLGDVPAARRAFSRIIEMDPGTRYAERAARELKTLGP